MAHWHRAQKPESDADHGINNYERHGVDHAPAFTAEDERQERAGLTVQDICEIEADLRGLVLDDAGGVRSASADGLGGPTSCITASTIMSEQRVPNLVMPQLPMMTMLFSFPSSRRK